MQKEKELKLVTKSDLPSIVKNALRNLDFAWENASGVYHTKIDYTK